MTLRNPRSRESIPAPSAADGDDDIVQRLIEANDVGSILRQMRDQHSAFIRTVVDRRVAPSPSVPRSSSLQLLSPLYTQAPAAPPAGRSANLSVLSPSMDDDDDDDTDDDNGVGISRLSGVPRFNPKGHAAESLKPPVARPSSPDRLPSDPIPVPGTPTPSSVLLAEEHNVSKSPNSTAPTTTTVQKPTRAQTTMATDKRPTVNKHREANAASSPQLKTTPEKQPAAAAERLSPGGSGVKNISLRNNQRQQQLKRNYDQLVKQSLAPTTGPAKVNVTTFSIDGPAAPDLSASLVKPEDDPFLLHAPFGYAQPAAHGNSHHSRRKDPFEGDEGDALSSHKSGGSQSDADMSDDEDGDPIVVERQQHIRSAAAASTGMKLRGTHYAVTPAGGCGSDIGAIHHKRNVTNETIGDYFETATLLSEQGQQQQPRQVAVPQVQPASIPTASLAKHKSNASAKGAGTSAAGVASAREPSPDPQSARNSGRKKELVSPVVLSGGKSSRPAQAVASGTANSTAATKAQKSAVQQASKDKPQASQKEARPTNPIDEVRGKAPVAASAPAARTSSPPLSTDGSLSDGTGSATSSYSYSYSSYYSSDYTGSFTSDDDDSPVRRPAVSATAKPQTGLATRATTDPKLKVARTQAAGGQAAPPAAASAQPKIMNRKPVQQQYPPQQLKRSQQLSEQQLAAQQQHLTRSASAASQRPTGDGQRTLLLSQQNQHSAKDLSRGQHRSSSVIIPVVPPNQLHLYKAPHHGAPPQKRPAAPTPAHEVPTSPIVGSTSKPAAAVAAVPSQPKMVMPHPYAPYAIPIEEYQRQHAAPPVKILPATSTVDGSAPLAVASSASSSAPAAPSEIAPSPSNPALPRFVARTAESSTAKYVWQSSDRGYLAPAMPHPSYEPPAILPEFGRSSSAVSLDNPVPLPSSRASSPSIVTTRFGVLQRPN